MFFRDLAKEIKDLLEKNYFFDQKLLVKTKNSSNVEWNAEGRMSTRGVQGSLSASLKNDVGFSLENLRIKTDGRILAEASLRLDESTKFIVSAEDGRQEPGKPLHSFGKIGVEYMRPTFSISSDIDVVNGPTLRASAMLEKYDFSGGFDVQYNSHFEDKELSPELVDFNFGIRYKGRDWRAFAKTTELLSSIRGGYLHHVNEKVSGAALFDYRLKTNYQKISIGSLWRIDGGTVIKAKIDSNAMLAASMKQKLSDHLSLTLCSEVNLQDLTADSHKFGIGITFK